MNIAVDIGNTSAKIGLFDGEELTKVVNDIDLIDLPRIIRESKCTNAILSSVANFDSEEAAKLKKSFEHFITLDYQTSVPIGNQYSTPETLGADRLAAAVAASKLFPGKNCLTIDIGTCITYDLINSGGEYLGGAISPGLSMKMKALNTFTARLPLIDIKENVRLVGRSTEESIQSGVIQGTIAEINEMIAAFQLKAPSLKIIICGGFTNFFETKLKQTIFAVPELVLMGLNTILLHNVD